MFTMDELLAIVQPHNDKIVAEYRANEAEAKMERLYAQIYDLKASLGAMVALMNSDVEDGRIRLTPTRADTLVKARELSRVDRR